MILNIIEAGDQIGQFVVWRSLLIFLTVGVLYNGAGYTTPLTVEQSNGNFSLDFLVNKSHRKAQIFCDIMADRVQDFWPLPPATARALSDKLYEKRKGAALEMDR